MRGPAPGKRDSIGHPGWTEAAAYCRWHHRQGARQDRQPVADSLQPAVARSELRFSLRSAPPRAKGPENRSAASPIEAQELVLGDAGYWSTAGIEFVRSRKADVLVRVNPQSFLAYGPQGRRVALLSRLRAIRQPGEIGEVEGGIARSKRFRRGPRLRHPQERTWHSASPSAPAAQGASKKQTTLKPETLEYAKYVIVFTTLAAESAGEVLECYRLRWQIEFGLQAHEDAGAVGASSQTPRRPKCARLAVRQIAGRAADPETDPGWTRYFPLGVLAPRSFDR